MMNRLICVVLIALLNTGFIYQTIDNIDLKRAVYFCKDRGGISWMSSDFIGQEKVACVNVGWSYLSAVEIGEEPNGT